MKKFFLNYISCSNGYESYELFDLEKTKIISEFEINVYDDEEKECVKGIFLSKDVTDDIHIFSSLIEGHIYYILIVPAETLVDEKIRSLVIDEYSLTIKELRTIKLWSKHLEKVYLEKLKEKALQQMEWPFLLFFISKKKIIYMFYINTKYILFILALMY